MSGYFEENLMKTLEVVGLAGAALLIVFMAMTCGNPVMERANAQTMTSLSSRAATTVRMNLPASDISMDQEEPIIESLAKPKETVEEVQEEPAVEEVYNEPVWEGDYDPYYEYNVDYGYSGGGSYNNDLRSAGVIYGDDGTRYTWYSQRVLPGGGLDIPGRHVDESGYVCDGDGNIAVASSDYAYGTQLETPFGPAVVYDSGCDSGTVDIYTDF